MLSFSIEDPAMNPSGAENQGEVVSDWVEAPESSHVAGFQLIDRSASSYGANSEVVVTFKGGGKNHKPPATYRYRFSNHDEARSVFDALSGADHPGSVVHELLKKRGVPYIGPI